MILKLKSADKVKDVWLKNLENLLKNLLKNLFTNLENPDPRSLERLVRHLECAPEVTRY